MSDAARERGEAVEPKAQPKSQFVSATLKVSRPSDVKSTDEAEWLEAFETDFWNDYPRKVGKFTARKAWLKITPWTQQTCDEIFAGLSRWQRYWDRHATEPQFIPHATTWLNQHRWEDEP